MVSRDSLQLHNICVYPSLWRTVLDQHFIRNGNEDVWEAGGTELRARRRDLSFSELGMPGKGDDEELYRATVCMI